MCCVRCCMWCFEKCVKYITRNAYIIIATQGKSFCSATFTVFHILLNHTTTVGVATVVSSLVILLGKIVIMATCSIAAYLALSSDAAINNTVLPVIFTAVLAYCVGTVFLDVYDMGIETIIISFCIDTDENSEGNYMYPPSLAKAMGTKARTAENDAKGEENKDETSSSSYKLPDDQVEKQESDGDFI